MNISRSRYHYPGILVISLVMALTLKIEFSCAATFADKIDYL